MHSLALFFVSLFLLSGVSAQGRSYPPQNIELDLIFPRNDTYVPLDFFPLIWGLQNAEAAWPMGLLVGWMVYPADEPVTISHDTGGFPPAGYSQDTDFYSSGDAPTDPAYFYTFPFSLRSFQPGHWRLEWRVGFKQNCSADAVFSDDHFLLQKRKELTFTINKEGKVVDLLKDRTCETEPATTFQVIDSISNWGNFDCPVMGNNVPKANPCTLPFNETIVEDITAVARGLGHCASGSLAELNDNCKRSEGGQVRKLDNHELVE